MDGKKAVVLVGNPTEGWEVVGPFEDFDAAAEWTEEKGLSAIASWITTLHSPDEPFEHPLCNMSIFGGL